MNVDELEDDEAIEIALRGDHAGAPLDVKKMLGVGVLGALGAMVLYYVFNSLSEDTQAQIKQSVSTAVKSSLQRLAAE